MSLPTSGPGSTPSSKPLTTASHSGSLPSTPGTSSSIPVVLPSIPAEAVASALRTVIQQEVAGALAGLAGSTPRTGAPTLPSSSSGVPATVPGAGGLGLPTAASLAGVPLFSTAPSAASSSLPMPGSIPPTFLSSLSSLLSTPIASPSTSSKLKPLVYSPALPPVPAKALEKIRANLYFDLKELLPDNAALLQRLQELGHLTALGSQPQSAVRLREINNPLTWIFCYLSFVAAKTESEETRDLIAYGQIILQLARRHGGPGWLTYDQQFRQQAAGGSLTPWREINNSLLSATVLAAQSETGTSPRRLFCTQCQGDDHASTECALGGTAAKEASSKGAGSFQARQTLSRKRFAPMENICRNFNRNACFADPCRYDHVCLLCSRTGHSARDCGREPKGKGKAGVSASETRVKGSRDPNEN